MYQILTFTGTLVATVAARNAASALRCYRADSGIGYPNGALFDGNYLVRRVLA